MRIIRDQIREAVMKDPKDPKALRWIGEDFHNSCETSALRLFWIDSSLWTKGSLKRIIHYKPLIRDR